jgi:predicted LPLAT superfamily acyltransferase
MMSIHNACFLVPCYNHGSTIERVVDSLRPFDLPIVIVDDGSNKETKQSLHKQALADDVTLLNLPENQGKGGAVMAGLRYAGAQNYSHAIQIDADGQHDVAAIPTLIERSKQYPDRVISGQPNYDESAPKSRLYGRYITHIWVWIETLSFQIKDSMCGFRAYPVSQSLSALNKYNIGKRMDFDTEILVRMYWDGVNIDFVDTKVIYPEGGISHFDALWDNVKISKMHAKLFFGMLPRIPSLLARKKKEGQHWSLRSEQGSIWGIKVLLSIYSFMGRRVFNFILKLVMAYYYVTGSTAKKSSEQYLVRVKEYTSQNNIRVTTKLTSYRHLLSFGQTMLDKLAAWRGDISYQDITVHGAEVFDDVIEQNKGIVLLGSHLGNIELCRAMSRHHAHLKINALVFTEHAQRFNTVMQAVNPSSELNLIQVSEIGPDTAIMLQQKLDQGEWIVVVGDRTSVTKETRVVWADFLGKSAPFPQGPFMLASVLKAPVFLLFGLRAEEHPDNTCARPVFNVYFERFQEQIILPRGKRQEALQKIVQEYAKRLEYYTSRSPLQWYNFFDFWKLSDKNND